jgi:hypothetical protein
VLGIKSDAGNQGRERYPQSYDLGREKFAKYGILPGNLRSLALRLVQGDSRGAMEEVLVVHDGHREWLGTGFLECYY